MPLRVNDRVITGKDWINIVYVSENRIQNILINLRSYNIANKRR